MLNLDTISVKSTNALVLFIVGVKKTNYKNLGY